MHEQLHHQRLVTKWYMLCYCSTSLHRCCALQRLHVRTAEEFRQVQPSLHEKLLQQELRPLRHSNRQTNKYVSSSSLLMCPAFEHCAADKGPAGKPPTSATTHREYGVLCRCSSRQGSSPCRVR
jgi:hypothetical protein